MIHGIYLVLAAIPLAAAADGRPARPAAEAGSRVTSPSPDAADSEARPAPRSASELRAAVFSAVRRRQRVGEDDLEQAALELLGLYEEVRESERLPRTHRVRLLHVLAERLGEFAFRLQPESRREAGPGGYAVRGGAEMRGDRRPAFLAQPVGPPAPGRARAAAPMAGPPGGAGPLAGPQPGGGAAGDYGEQLADLIRRTIAPSTWDTMGGPGTIHYWQPGQAMVVRQRQDVHQQIGDLFRQLERVNR